MRLWWLVQGALIGLGAVAVVVGAMALVERIGYMDGVAAARASAYKQATADVEAQMSKSCVMYFSDKRRTHQDGAVVLCRKPHFMRVKGE